MIKTRSFRSLICLLLICCFLVHGMAPRAEAFGLLTGSTVLVAAGSVIATLLIGAGIQQAYENSPAFQNLVDNIKSIWTDQGIVVNDQIEVLRVPGQSAEDAIYAVKESLIESVVDIAYESGAISFNRFNGVSLSGGAIIKVGNEGLKCTADSVAYVFKARASNSTGTLVLVTTDVDAVFYDCYYSDPMDQPAYSLNVDGLSYLYTYESVDLKNCGYPVYVYNGNSANFLTAILTGEFDPAIDQITIADGLTAGQIATQGSSIAAGYPSWAANSFGYQNSAEKYYPIALGDTYANTVSKSQEQVWEGVSEYTTEVLSNWDAMLAILGVLKAYISTHIPNLISEKLDDVKATVISLPDTFSNWFERGISIGESILDKVLALPQTIADSVAVALAAAFELDPGYMQAEFEDLMNDFTFLGSMIDFGRGVVDVFYGIGTKPPIMYVDLSSAESEYDYGNRVVFMDLTWYSRYKPYGDAIISSFLWAYFGWRLLQNLPSLLNGSSGAVPHFKHIKFGSKGGKR